jgi:hypothetical protein
MRFKIKTSKRKIVTETNARWRSEGRKYNYTSTECWRCQAHTTLIRAHIVADVNGGPDAPSGFFLLCETCHREQPDTCTMQTQWVWLMARELIEARFGNESNMVNYLMTYMGNAQQREQFFKELIEKTASVLFESESRPIDIFLRDIDDVQHQKLLSARIAVKIKDLKFIYGEANPAGRHKGNVRASSCWKILDLFDQWLRQHDEAYLAEVSDNDHLMQLL